MIAMMMKRRVVVLLLLVMICIMSSPSSSFSTTISVVTANEPTPQSRTKLNGNNGGGGKIKQASSPAFLSTAATAIDTFWRQYPYAAAGLTCGFKASMADLVAQKRQEQQDGGKGSKKEVAKFDYKRNLAFTVYGAVYQGMAQEFIYNHMYGAWFGVGTNVRTVLTKVLFDLLIQTTLLTLPAAYFCKALIYRYSAGEALRRYWNDIKHQGLLLKYFALWGPVQCCTFSIVPEHWRVTFIAFVSFFWLIILSTISSRKVKGN